MMRRLRYVQNRVAQLLGVKFSRLLRESSFSLQAAMDINPNSLWYSSDFATSIGGFYPLNDNESSRAVVSAAPWDSVRRDMFILLMRSIVEREVQGSLAEVGVYNGLTAKVIHHYMPERVFHLFDTFEGFDERDFSSEFSRTGLKMGSGYFQDTSVEGVKKYVRIEGNDNLFIYKGYFPESIPEKLKEDNFALVHMDVDLYQPTLEAFHFFYPRLSPGGVIVVHDYNGWPGPRAAIQDFMRNKPEVVVPMPDKSGSAVIIKQS